VPERVALHDVAVGIFSEVAQQMTLQLDIIPPETDQGSFQPIFRAREPSKCIAGTKTSNFIIPGMGKKLSLQLLPRMNSNILHVPLTPFSAGFSGQTGKYVKLTPCLLLSSKNYRNTHGSVGTTAARSLSDLGNQSEN
jgi:hypothetical protein